MSIDPAQRAIRRQRALRAKQLRATRPADRLKVATGHLLSAMAVSENEANEAAANHVVPILLEAANQLLSVRTEGKTDD